MPQIKPWSFGLRFGALMLAITAFLALWVMPSIKAWGFGALNHTPRPGSLRAWLPERWGPEVRKNGIWKRSLPTPRRVGTWIETGLGPGNLTKICFFENFDIFSIFLKFPEKFLLFLAKNIFQTEIFLAASGRARSGRSKNMLISGFRDIWLSARRGFGRLWILANRAQPGTSRAQPVATAHKRFPIWNLGVGFSYIHMHTRALRRKQPMSKLFWQKWFYLFLRYPPRLLISAARWVSCPSGQNTHLERSFNYLKS